MNPKDFASSNTGQCIKTTGGYWAFLPALLPPVLNIDMAMVSALSRADSALGTVAGLTLGGAVPRMQALLQAFSRREAVLSSRIEGTQTQLAELFLFDVRPSPPEDDVQEVQNYFLALQEGVKQLNELPISLRAVRNLHRTLLSGVRGQDKTPGEFRTRQNCIGRPGDTVETARYVPPPVEEMHRLLANWEQFVNERGKFPDLIQCAIMHEQFEAIHPFADGNGRVGRLLISLFLVERKLLPQPYLYLSGFFEAHRPDYYELLQNVRTRGEWGSWIRFFLVGIAETSHSVTRQARHLETMRQQYRDQLNGKARARELLDALLANPYTTVVRAAALLHISKPTAQKIIDQLRQVGILEETTGKSWGRVYVAKPILKAIENPPEAENEGGDP
jgi:Fic family protein